MKTYLVAIIISAIFIVLGNTFVYSGVSVLLWHEIVLVTIAFIVLMIMLDAIVALLLHEFPKLFCKNFMEKTKFYNADRFPFKVYKFERKIYEKIGVKKWKDLLPNKMGMRKDKIEDKNNSNYLNMFIIESCRAEFMHGLSAVFSLVVAIFLPFKYITISLPVIFVNIILQILPVLVQRYNRPKIKALYIRAKRTEEKVS